MDTEGLLKRPLHPEHPVKRPLCIETDESSTMQPATKRSRHIADRPAPHATSFPETTVIDRETTCAQSDCHLSLVERLQAIAVGAPDNHKQAEKELKKAFVYSMQSGGKLDSTIMCASGTGTGPSGEARIIFTKDTWHIKDVRRDKSHSFHMNDLIRQLYIKILKMAPFDISNPNRIIVGPIDNIATLEQLALNSKTNGNGFQKIETLYPSPQGKLLKCVLSDFNFHAEYYCETDGGDEQYVEDSKLYHWHPRVSAENYLNGVTIHPHICIILKNK